MMPWTSACDNLNDRRYLPYYYSEMTNLPEQYPAVYQHLLQGGFAVQLGKANPFGKIPVDQTIEESVNKDTKASGGTTRYSLKEGAVSRFYLTSEYRSGYLRHFRAMVDLPRKDLQHPDLHTTRIQVGEKAVLSLIETITEWTNPFSPSDELSSFSTGSVATHVIQPDLLTAH